jgi:hypothetical protein
MGILGATYGPGALLHRGRRARSAAPAQPRSGSRSLSGHGVLLPHDLRHTHHSPKYSTRRALDGTTTTVLSSRTHRLPGLDLPTVGTHARAVLGLDTAQTCSRAHAHEPTSVTNFLTD